ncbi:MAG: hypothetical protein JJU29_02410 [Verrucomicrobia bacterium]|nr:hypothetical protein [Verrucomicrobiota bacterium]MCH8511190.1 hypothetical protein [Kiritimatiellia bacterium]
MLSAHNCGAVFSSHNFDRAVVKDILFENIRIEGRPIRDVDADFIRNRKVRIV